ESSAQNFVGGICGYSQSGNINKVITSANLMFDVVSNSGKTFFGGVVGQNGKFASTNTSVSLLTSSGSTLQNVVCKKTITIKAPNEKDVYAGGLVGLNNHKDKDPNIKSSMFVGSIKYFCKSVDNVGGLVGYNINKNGEAGNDAENVNNFADDCLFVEDLCLAPKRNVEFAAAVTYVDFVNKVKDGEIKIDENDEDVSGKIGENLTFVEGSVYNPININDASIISSCKDGKYYVVSTDLVLNESITEFKGILVGGGHKLSISNTFAENISQNAIISGLLIELASTNIQKFNGNEFAKNICSIVANSNFGALYNLVVKGNMFVDGKACSPVALENKGFMNVITSKAHIVGTNLGIDSAEIAGFVVKNNGVIYNSLACGNIEIYSGEYNIASKDTYSSGANKVYGFVAKNNDTIVNAVSATTLPIREGRSGEVLSNESFGGNSTTTKFVNCYVDILANGNYLKPALDSGIKYLPFEELFAENEKIENIKLKNANSGLWTSFDKSVLFGYSYPILSTSKNLADNSDNNADRKQFLTTTETIDESTYYLVNNFSSFKSLIKALNDEDAIEKINIKQIASFVANAKRKEETGLVDALAFETIKLEKDLCFDGNNFAILNFEMTSKDGIAGLFVAKENENIKISNSALVNAKILINFAKSKTGEEQAKAIDSVVVGGFVASTLGKVEISGCYVDGTISCLQTEKLDYSGEADKTMIVGGLAGSVGNDSKIENSISSASIKLDYTSAEIQFLNNNAVKLGYVSTIGGIVAKATNTQILNNYVFGDVVASSSIGLNAGGIVGDLSGGKLESNVMLGAVAYKGSYLGYYKDDDDNLIYNINAIVGKLDAGTTLGASDKTNKYNKLLSLTNDEKVSETSLDNVVTMLNSELDINAFTKSGETQILNKPEFVVVESNSYTFKDNTNYVVKGSGDFAFAYDTDEQGRTKKDLTNVTILFENARTVTISDSLFDKLTNVTIANLNVKSSQTLTSPAIAKTIVNTKLYNISIDDIHFERTSATACGYYASFASVGGVVDYVISSVLTNVVVNNGRLEAKFADRGDFDTLFVGGIVGFAEQTLLNSCENSATITSSNQASFGDMFVAGLLGGARNTSLFKCTNLGLVYAKNATANNVKMRTAGIANGDSGTNFASFCKNEGKIKAVNDYSSSSCFSYVSGVATGMKILYSINDANIISIAKAKSNNVVATGVGTDATYYSYHFAGVMGTTAIYTITSGNGYCCYSIGGGYTSSSSENDKVKTSFGGEYNYDFDDTQSGTSSSETPWYDPIVTNNHDFAVAGGDLIRPVIKLIDSTDAYTLPTVTENGETKYALSSAFELWFWSRYVCGTANDKGVVLTDDIDMTGYKYITPTKAFTKTFDGRFHTISSLRIEGNSENNSLYYGLVAINNGTIKDINFENPYLLEMTHFEKNNYISVVAGQNKGTIENILIGQSEGETEFIDLSYDSDVETGDVTVCVGSICGENAGDIKNCEVINFKDCAIRYSFGITLPTSWDSNNLTVYAGGIVGSVSGGKVESCSFMSAIDGTAINENMHNVAIGDQGLNEMVAGCYSKVDHKIGLVVGNKAGGNFNNNYAPENDPKKVDKFIHMISENLYDGVEVGQEILGLQTGTVAKVARHSRVAIKAGRFVGKGGQKIFNKLSKKGAKDVAKKAVKKGASLMSRIGIPDITDVIDIIAFVAVEVQKTNSFDSTITTSGYSSTLSGNVEFGSEYIKPYHDGLNTSVQPYSFFKESMENGGLGWTEATYVPYNENFMKLSMSKTKPSEKNDAYYVYDVNQFAYAFAGNATHGKTTVYLMDNIDMTRKVWDTGLSGVKSGLTVYDNGFKVVYGANADFADKFDNMYNADILVATKEDANEYGKFDNISRNAQQAAYDSFKSRFDNAWKESYKAQTGASDAGADDKLAKAYIEAKSKAGDNAYPLSF
ncbi:MAG: hypothetical protein ACI4TI_03425, partial [Christensenellales bacterium]